MAALKGPPHNLDGGDFGGVAREPELATHTIFDRLRDVGILFQELLRVFAALAEALAAVREPRAAFLDNPFVDADVDEIAVLRDAFAVHHVELGFAEWGRDLVLDDLDARPATHDRVAVLDAGDTADVHAHRRVELQRAAAGGRFGVAEHHADLLAQ